MVPLLAGLLQDVLLVGRHAEVEKGEKGDKGDKGEGSRSAHWRGQVAKHRSLKMMQWRKRVAKYCLKILVELLLLAPAEDKSKRVINPPSRVRRELSAPYCAAAVAKSLLFNDPQVVHLSTVVLAALAHRNPRISSVLKDSGAIYSVLLYHCNRSATTAASPALHQHSILPMARLLSRCAMVCRQQVLMRFQTPLQHPLHDRYSHDSDCYMLFPSHNGISRLQHWSSLRPYGGFLERLFPRALLWLLLEGHIDVNGQYVAGTRAFGRVFTAETECPELVWTGSMRERLGKALRWHTAAFVESLRENTHTRPQFVALPVQIYPELVGEIWCGVYLGRLLEHSNGFDVQNGAMHSHRKISWKAYPTQQCTHAPIAVQLALCRSLFLLLLLMLELYKCVLSGKYAVRI